jgi:glycosyltransferase involved in cell wall biosynthesis
MRVIFDARALRLYPVGKPGFKGGTELMVERIARGLAMKGHTVHVVTPDLEQEEQRHYSWIVRDFPSSDPGRASIWWWGPHNFPRNADAVVLVHNMQGLEADYEADHLIVATNGLDPYCGPDHEWAAGVDAWPVFSQHHLDLLCGNIPTIQRNRCYITGLGVDLSEFSTGVPKVPGRLFWASDPARGLWHLLDVFDHVKRAESSATLHVAYDFGAQFAYHQWQANSLAEALWECKQRLEATQGVVSLGAVDTAQLRREQAECQVFAYPCDPVTAGSELFCLSAMEAAAAGCALVLGENEALPEVFEDAAMLLPLPGKWLSAHDRRYDAQDWADQVVGLMQDPANWERMSQNSRALAERNSWAAVIERWEEMLRGLKGE